MFGLSVLLHQQFGAGRAISAYSPRYVCAFYVGRYQSFRVSVMAFIYGDIVVLMSR